MTIKLNKHQIKTDQQLLLEIKNGKTKSFEELFKRHIRFSYSIANQGLKNTEIAEEIVQNVWADIWIARERKDIQRFKSYLSCALAYQVRTFHKKKTQLPNFVSLSDVTDKNAILSDHLISSLTADSLINTKQITECVDIWSKKLPPKRRKIFTLNHHECLSTNEISKTLKITQKTVQNQLLNANTSLRRKIKKILILGLAGSSIMLMHNYIKTYSSFNTCPTEPTVYILNK